MSDLINSRNEELAVMQIELSYLDALRETFIQDEKNIVLARRYHSGDQDVYLTERVKEFLALHNESNPFKLNICRTVVTAVRDELSVNGFDTDESDSEDGSKKQAGWAWDVWNANHMDTIQNEVHEAALRDRETFIMVDWDKDNKRPRFTQHQRFTELSGDGGDGDGVWILYENDDPHQRPIVAVHQWYATIYDPKSAFPVKRIRRNLYYPDHIEKWVYQTGWEHVVEDDVDWFIPWVDKAGLPLGIPVIHFRNENMTPEAWDAIPIQDAINKTLIDILASGDLTAFRIFKVFGWYPTTDGKEPKQDGTNLLKFSPGQIIGSNKAPSDASMDAVDGADPTPLMNVLKDLIVMAAQITNTPATRFTMSGHVSSAESVKEQERPLKKKAANRRVIFGDSWEHCISMARKIANLYGDAGLDEAVSFYTLWTHTESLDELVQKLTLGVPQEKIWAEMGYSQDQIKEMRNMDEFRLKNQLLLWQAAAQATQAGMPLETYLMLNGFTAEQLKNMGTQKLAEIKLQQQDVVPTVKQ